MDLPPNFQVGQATGDGDCFFDSVAQALKQLKPELDLTVKSLRLICKIIAQSQLRDQQSWLREALKEENEHIYDYVLRIEFSATDFHENSDVVNILGLTSPVWGISEIEGRIICKKYNVNLHIVEQHIVEGKEIWTHQIVDSGGSKSVDTVDYSEENTVHILKAGDLHFQPILRFKENQRSKEPSDSSDDDDEEDVKMTAGEELFYAIKSNDSEIEKVKKVKTLFKRTPKPDIDFQGINNDTCLHIAVRNMELKVIKLLVKEGARTDIKNDKNRSALDIAKRLKRQDILKLLQPDIFVKEQKERNHENGDGRNKKSEQQNAISSLTDDELLSKNRINFNRDDETTEGKYNKLVYEKRPGTAGMHGQLYEINLLMMLLLQAEVKEINSFCLATNVQGAGAFDDIVFKYKSKNGKKMSIIFLQAKHKESEKGNRLTIDSLLSKSGKGDIQLRKYLSAYIKIKQLTISSKRNYPLLLHDIDKTDFVIYTNAASNFEKSSDSIKKKNLEPEHALHFAENFENYYYQLNATEAVKEVLRHSLDFEILVRELAQSVYSGSIESRKHIFEDYYLSLADRVLQITDTNRKESQLRQDFLDGTADAEFTGAFLSEIKNNKDFSTFSAKSDNELKQKLRKKIIKLPENFDYAQGNDLKLPLPNKTISDETIEEFLKNLKLFIDQPNVNDLEVALREMIMNIFKIKEKDTNLVYCDINGKITKWWREQGKVQYLTEHSKLFVSAKVNLSNMHLVGLAILYAKRFKSLGLSFTRDQIQTLSKLIRVKQILHIVSDGDAVLLSTVKVYQTIEGMFEYKSEDDNYKYIFLSLTSALELKSKVIDAFKSEKSDLLVIECEGTEKNFEEFYDQLNIIVKPNKSKKIVLITRENDPFGEQFKHDFSMDCQHQEEIDRKNTLADLDIESQACIEKKKIIFQGIETELGTLVDEKSKHLVSADVLSKVINGERIKVDKTLGDLGEGKYYYINRIFHYRANIRKDCFKDINSDNIFVVSKVKDNELSLLGGAEKVRKFKDIDLDTENPVRFIILDDGENVPQNLKQLYTKYPTCNIHWLKKEGNKFLWQESHGSLSNLREFVDTDDITEYSTDEITSTRNRIVIVSAEPGMGKSVLLTKLAGIEKKTDSSIWVAKINLSDFTKQLKEAHFDENNLKGTINFLSDVLDLQTLLEKQLFKHRVENQGKIILLFDGFDEISPHYKEKVVALVRILKETKVNKLWITTRPHMRNELEDKLSVLSYSLKPLSMEDQKHFLKKFWGRELDLKDDNHDERLNTYIEKLLKVWSVSIRDEERDFAGIPLQTKMLAEIYHEKFKEFYSSDQSIPSFPIKLNLVDLYQSFVEKKYDIYWIEKTKADTTSPAADQVRKNNRSKFLKQHQLLALEMILSEQDLNFLLDEKEKKKIINFKSDVIKGIERTGIIILTSNETLNFIHRTFAEYFTAFWLADNLGRKEVKNLLSSKLFESESKVLRSFFDPMLASHEENENKNELHNAVFTKDIIKVKELCSGSRNSDVDKGGRTALHLAAAYGLSEIAEVLLENNPDAIHMEDTIFGWRPLRYADRGKHWHFVELLLQQGAISDDISDAISIIPENFNGSTLLHKAAEDGLVKLTELLIQRGAYINAKNLVNRTPLDYAVKKGNFDIVKLLIEKGADLQYQDHEGNTVLHDAALSGNLEVLKFLLKQGADIKCQNKYGNTVLHDAAFYSNFDVVEFLLEKGADIKCHNKSGNPVLHHAAFYGKWDAVMFLLETGADIKCQNKYGDTALHHVAKRGNSDVVKLLLEKGADIKSQNHEGNTVLHQAAFSSKWDVVKLLLEKGASIKCQNKYGNTVLHYAALHSNLNVVEFLLDKRADIMCQNHQGNTILHHAAFSKKWDVVKFLLEKGADIKCQNKYGNTILHHAAFSSRWDVVKFLLEKGADIKCQNHEGNTVLHHAAKKGNLNVVKFLLEIAVDIKCQNKPGNTALHLATFSSQWDVVKLLLEKGADIKGQNHDGNTVLHHAAKIRKLDVVKFLLKKGADIECPNHEGNTVLHHAAFSSKWDVVKLLLETGADIKCQNKYGNTVLHHAAFSGKWDAVMFLLEKGADIKCQNHDGNTVLHHTAKKGNLDVVKFLLEKGADIKCQNYQGNTVLHHAAKKGNLDVVKFLLEKEADIKCQNHEGNTVLHHAAKKGNLDVVKFLLEKEADIKCQNHEGNTVLHHAAKKGNLGVVKFLLEKGADIESHNHQGNTVLHHAAQKGNLDVVKFLLEKEAIIESQNYEGNTVLHDASFSGKWDVVKFLLEKGASIKCRNDEGNTVLFYAAKKGNLDVVKLLIEKGAGIQCQNKYGNTVLYHAAFSGKWDVVKFFLENGANVKCQNHKGNTILHHAAKKGNLDVVKFLLEKGADIKCQNHEGNTVLHHAALSGNLDVVMFLLEKGAVIKCQNHEGNTVLHHAAFYSKWDVVKFLLEKGADIKCQNKYGNTVLHHAAKKRDSDVVKFLLEKGDDIKCPNRQGNTFLHHAALSGNLDVVKLLIEKGADIKCQNKYGNTVLHHAAFSSKWDVVKFLLKKGADIKFRNHEGNTVLHYAASSGNLDVVKFLLEKGADIKSQNHEGNTVLHHAAFSGKWDVGKFILEKGADIKGQNKYGNTVLHHAAKKGNLDAVKFLLEKGADIKCQNKYGNTVLHHAAKKGNLDAVKFLLEKGADIKCQNHEGNTVLHHAAKKRNLDVVKFLLAKEADIKCQNKYGNTVLHHAAFSSKWGVVKFLLENGADIKGQNRYGNTVLHHASKKGNLDVVNFLLANEADIKCQNHEGNTVLHNAAKKGNLDVIKFLLEKADIKCRNHEGNTVLHHAASFGKWDVVKFLLEKGADIKGQNHVGNTILHHAASFGKWDVVKFLLEKGADVKCENHVGITVLHHAASSGKWDVVKVFLEKGSDV